MRVPARFPVLHAKQAGRFPLFNCPTLTPHSSNHEDSQMLLCNIHESKTYEQNSTYL
jgi:hypothetical protein